MLFLPVAIPGLPMPRYLENALWLRTGRTRTPFPSLSKSNLSPVRTPSTRRTSRGTVICPLLVIVACFCMRSLLFLTLSHSPYFSSSRVLGHESQESQAKLSPYSPAIAGSQSRDGAVANCCFDFWCWHVSITDWRSGSLESFVRKSGPSASSFSCTAPARPRPSQSGHEETSDYPCARCRDSESTEHCYPVKICELSFDIYPRELRFRLTFGHTSPRFYPCGPNTRKSGL